MTRYSQAMKARFIRGKIGKNSCISNKKAPDISSEACLIPLYAYNKIKICTMVL
jgi:hypothetical protein